MKNLVTELADKGVSHHEENKLLWHLNTYYEERWRKKGLMESEEISKIPPPPPWPHETPLRVKLLPLTYQGTSNKFREQVSFHTYLGLLGQGAYELSVEFGKACEKEEAMSTPTVKSKVPPIAEEENAHAPQHFLHHCEIGSSHDETLWKAIVVSGREGDTLEEEEPRHWMGEEMKIHEPGFGEVAQEEPQRGEHDGTPKWEFRSMIIVLHSMTGRRTHDGGIGLHGDAAEGVKLRSILEALEGPRPHDKDQEEPCWAQEGFRTPRLAKEAV